MTTFGTVARRVLRKRDMIASNIFKKNDKK